MKLKLIVACVTGLCLSSVALAVEPFTIKDIRIEGLERMEPTTVFSYMPVQIGDTFNDIKGERIIKDLYHTGFFQDVHVETQNDQVLITVTERPIISTLDVTGSKLISGSLVLKNLSRIGLAPAHVYDPVLMQQAIEGLKHEYKERGKNNVKVVQEIKPLDRNRVAITLKVIEGPTTVIENIHFVGNKHYSSYRLRQLMSLSEEGLFTWFTKSDRFSQDKLNADLKKITDFYQNNGYFNFKILSTETVPAPQDKNDLQLEIQLSEGERYHWGKINVQGDTKDVSLDSLQKLVKINTHDWYDASELDTILKDIQNHLGDKGYALAQIHVDPQVDEANKTVGFNLTVNLGPRVYINEIHINGNNKTRDKVIRREFRQMEASAYNHSKIERSRVRVEQLGYFDKVDITPQPVAGRPDAIDLNMVVKERPTGSLNAAIGYAQGDGLILSGSVSQNNLFGTGKSIGAQVMTGGSNKVASLSFNDPYFTPDGVGLGYNVFWRTYDPNKTSISAYKTRTYGVGMQMNVPITEYDNINLGLGVNNMKISLYPQSPQRYKDFVNEYGQSNWIINGTVGWGRNTTDSAVWPTRGYIMGVNLDTGLPGGGLQYYKLTHSQKWFFPVTQDLTLMLSGHVGFGAGYHKTKELPFFYNFYSGGIGSVRGYQNGSIGPKSYDQYGNIDNMGGTREAGLSAEVLFPMPGLKDNKSVRLSVFADAGSVWDGNSYNHNNYIYYNDTYQSTFKNELRYSAGVAFTWVSPVGPLKFSYAYPIHRKPGDQIQRFQFQLGTVF